MTEHHKPPDETQAGLNALEAQLTQAHQTLARLASVNYPVTLRLEQQQVQQLLAVLESATRLTGLLTLDITCADGQTDAADIRELYDNDGNVASRNSRRLKMAARRLDHLQGQKEDEPTW